jgi:hypothetical protein
VDSVKKNIAFNTVYDLEEFLVRMYKVGFLVTRLKNGVAKPRIMTIDHKGKFCFHKLMSKGTSKSQPVKNPKPYFKIPIRILTECFPCDDEGKPTFIMDCKSKILHLGVDSKLDRDYLTKGIQLIMQKTKVNPKFLEKNSYLADLSPGNQRSKSGKVFEDDEDGFEEFDDDDMTTTTMNTFKR